MRNKVVLDPMTTSSASRKPALEDTRITTIDVEGDGKNLAVGTGNGSTRDVPERFGMTSSLFVCFRALTGTIPH